MRSPWATPLDALPPWADEEPLADPERCARCGSAEIGYDFALGWNCRACGGADSDE